MRNQLLTLTQFGNPILRRPSRKLTKSEIKSDKIQRLISNLRHTCQEKDYGIGLAAPQVGQALAIAVIAIKPTANRPDLERFEQVIINPTYKGVLKPVPMWEGCMSSGTGDNTLFAQADRYERIEATWLDEHAQMHTRQLDGVVAHVFQHEADHLRGILFVDRVKDSKTYMLASEYRRRITHQK